MISIVESQEASREECLPLKMISIKMEDPLVPDITRNPHSLIKKNAILSTQIGLEKKCSMILKKKKEVKKSIRRVQP